MCALLLGCGPNCWLLLAHRLTSGASPLSLVDTATGDSMQERVDRVENKTKRTENTQP